MQLQWHVQWRMAECGMCGLARAVACWCWARAEPGIEAEAARRRPMSTPPRASPDMLEWFGVSGGHMRAAAWAVGRRD